MRLSEKLRMAHVSGDFGLALEGYAEEAEQLEIWDRFACYLLDKCEGETITEENLQRWLADMIKDES